MDPVLRSFISEVATTMTSCQTLPAEIKVCKLKNRIIYFKQNFEVKYANA